MPHKIKNLVKSTKYARPFVPIVKRVIRKRVKPLLKVV